MLTDLAHTNLSPRNTKTWCFYIHQDPFPKEIRCCIVEKFFLLLLQSQLCVQLSYLTWHTPYHFKSFSLKTVHTEESHLIILTQSKRHCLSYAFKLIFFTTQFPFFPKWLHPIILFLGVLISHIFVHLERP